MATKYDPEIIQKLADQLYSQANTIVVISTLVFLIIGGAAGYAVDRDFGGPAIAGLVVGGIIGYFIGQARAFVLRVQAQTALCQRQIEYNTRH